MKRFLVIFAGALLALSLQATALGQTAEKVDVAGVIRAFTAKETEFRKALNQYTFKRDAVFQTIGMGGQVSGEYRRTSSFIFTPEGERSERITYFPPPTLTEITFTSEDLEDLGGIQPFALEASKMDRYSFNYVGREKIDELDTYVFDVGPKVMPKEMSQRLFQGRIWVDDKDLQIVKVRGKGVPEGKQRFPTFETYRQQIDGKFWFPVYTYAEEELVFKDGNTVRIKLVVRYTDYKRFQGRVRVIEEGDPGDLPNETPKP